MDLEEYQREEKRSRLEYRSLVLDAIEEGLVTKILNWGETRPVYGIYLFQREEKWPVEKLFVISLSKNQKRCQSFKIFKVQGAVKRLLIKEVTGQSNIYHLEKYNKTMIDGAPLFYSVLDPMFFLKCSGKKEYKGCEYMDWNFMGPKDDGVNVETGLIQKSKQRFPFIIKTKNNQLREKWMI